MNRTQALERVDEILDLFTRMYVSGSCPRCGVRLLHEDDGLLPPRTSVARTVVHHAHCEMDGSTGELVRLTRRFAIPLEPVLLTVPRTDTTILTVRRVVD